MLEHFDTSDYAENNIFNMPRVNRKILGKMKDELGGDVMREFAGLRSKMYAYTTEAGETIKRAKGAKKSVVKFELSFEDYKKCLFEGEDVYKIGNRIQSFKHELYSISANKKVLSSSDDKRLILDDGIATLPWGHYKTNQ